MTEKEQIEELTRFQCADCGDGCENCPYNVTLCPAKERATKIYNANFRKQKEGEWIEYREKRLGGEVYYICSRCGRRESHKEPYCNCGAKMKEGEQT